MRLNYKGGYITPMCARFHDAVSLLVLLSHFSKKELGQQMSWGPNLCEQVICDKKAFKALSTKMRKRPYCEKEEV